MLVCGAHTAAAYNRSHEVNVDDDDDADEQLFFQLWHVCVLWLFVRRTTDHGGVLENQLHYELFSH